ncbi:hypothetical protein MBLNU230_g6329t2 [Neophaeotheca triangularis]
MSTTIPRTILRSLATKPTTRAFTTTRLTMGQKHEWIVILPDSPNALSKRMEVRPQHIANLKPSVDSGFTVMGGALLDEPIKEGESPKINGSIICASAESREEIMENLKKDIYWETGVWDASKVSFLRFSS